MVGNGSEKAACGNPGLSKKRAYENRVKTLAVEWKDRGKVNKVNLTPLYNFAGKFTTKWSDNVCIFKERFETSTCIRIFAVIDTNHCYACCTLMGRSAVHITTASKHCVVIGNFHRSCQENRKEKGDMLEVPHGKTHNSTDLK